MLDSKVVQCTITTEHPITDHKDPRMRVRVNVEENAYALCQSPLMSVAVEQ